MTTEINANAAAAAATKELVIKEKVEAVQEPGDQDDEEIPQLVPMQTTSLAELKVINNIEKLIFELKLKILNC